jgi:hypothetical protein
MSLLYYRSNSTKDTIQSKRNRKRKQERYSVSANSFVRQTHYDVGAVLPGREDIELTFSLACGVSATVVEEEGQDNVTYFDWHASPLQDLFEEEGRSRQNLTSLIYPDMAT